MPLPAHVVPETIRKAIADAHEVRPLKESTDGLAAMLSDRLRESERAAWEPTLSLYRLLRVLAMDDQKLQKSLEPVSAFFVKRRARKPAATAAGSVGGPGIDKEAIDKTG